MKRGHNNKSKVKGRTARKYADQQGERRTECQEEKKQRKKKDEKKDLLHFSNIILQETSRVLYGEEEKREGRRERQRETQGGKEKTEEGLKIESMVGKKQMELRSFKVTEK